MHKVNWKCNRFRDLQRQMLISRHVAVMYIRLIKTDDRAIGCSYVLQATMTNREKCVETSHPYYCSWPYKDRISAQLFRFPPFSTFVNYNYFVETSKSGFFRRICTHATTYLSTSTLKFCNYCKL